MPFHAMIWRPLQRSSHQLTLILLILISLNQLVTSDRPSFQCKRPQPFDRLLLALQWPPGVCYQNIHKTCIVNANQFLIHGAWPSNASGASPEFCCSDRFRREELKSIQSQLSDKWKTLFQGNDESFWKHEWNKHGTCASASSPGLKGASNYFNITLQIYDKTNIKEWLREARIVPLPATDRRSYAIADLHDAIEKRIGKRIYLDCKRLPRKISPFPILTGVHVCLNPSSLEYIDCQTKDDIDCGNGNLMFLSSGSTTTGFGLTSLMLLLVVTASAVAV